MEVNFMQITTKYNLCYKVKKDDTVANICKNFKIDEYSLKMLNKTSSIQANDIILIPKPYEHIYVVKPLDTYEKIAKELNVSVDKIIEVTKGKKMYIGQKIVF